MKNSCKLKSILADSSIDVIVGSMAEMKRLTELVGDYDDFYNPEHMMSVLMVYDSVHMPWDGFSTIARIGGGRLNIMMAENAGIRAMSVDELAMLLSTM